MPTTQARVPATRKPTKAKKETPDSDVEVISTDDDANTFVARLFDDDEGDFTFWSDTNFMMMLIAFGGEGEDLGQLSTIVKSLLWVPDGDENAGRETWRRFIGVLAKQRKMTPERSMKFINDLIAAAGKDQQEPSDD